MESIEDGVVEEDIIKPESQDTGCTETWNAPVTAAPPAGNASSLLADERSSQEYARLFLLDMELQLRIQGVATLYDKGMSCLPNSKQALEVFAQLLEEEQWFTTAIELVGDINQWLPGSATHLLQSAMLERLVEQQKRLEVCQLQVGGRTPNPATTVPTCQVVDTSQFITFALRSLETDNTLQTNSSNIP